MRRAIQAAGETGEEYGPGQRRDNTPHPVLDSVSVSTDAGSATRSYTPIPRVAGGRTTARTVSWLPPISAVAPLRLLPPATAIRMASRCS